MSTPEEKALAPAEGLEMQPIGGALSREDVTFLSDLAKTFTASGMFPDLKTQAQALVKILAGRELGVPPVASVMGIYVIKGRTYLGANLLASRVQAHPKYDYEVIEHTDEACNILFRHRRDREWVDVGSSRFTHDEAKAAGLTVKDNWKNWRRNMLFARALSNGVKWHCPEVGAGMPLYEISEAQDADLIDRQGHRVLEVTPDGNLQEAPGVPAEDIEAADINAALREPAPGEEKPGGLFA